MSSIEQRYLRNMDQKPIPIKIGFFDEKVNYAERPRFLDSIKKCRYCNCRNTYFDPVPPEGNVNSYYYFQGRNPGIKEANSGTPFNPKAPGGRLLQRYLEVLGLQRSEVYITNTLFCYKRDDEPPSIREVYRCMHHKDWETRFLNKVRFVFLLGNDAFRSILGQGRSSILNHVGLTFVGGTERPAYYFPILHPGYILRNHELMNMVEHQLRMIRKEYIEPFKGGLEQ